MPYLDGSSSGGVVIGSEKNLSLKRIKIMPKLGGGLWSFIPGWFIVSAKVVGAVTEGVWGH